MSPPRSTGPDLIASLSFLANSLWLFLIPFFVQMTSCQFLVRTILHVGVLLMSVEGGEFHVPLIHYLDQSPPLLLGKSVLEVCVLKGLFPSFFFLSLISAALIRTLNEYSLKGLILKLKLQYFGHQVLTLEKTLMLGKIEARRRRG